MQAINYNQFLSESNLLNCGWPVVEGILHWKDGFGVCLGVAKSDFNYLFNVLKTMSLYFHLIKTVKLSFKYMEFTTNYHWFCSFFFLFFSLLTPHTQLTIKHYPFSFKSRTTVKRMDSSLACINGGGMWLLLIHIAQYVQCQLNSGHHFPSLISSFLWHWEVDVPC